MMQLVRDYLNLVLEIICSFNQVLDWKVIVMVVMVVKMIWDKSVEPESDTDLRTKRLSRLDDFISSQLIKADPTTSFTRIFNTSAIGNENFEKIPIAEMALFLAEESIRGVILELFPLLNHRDYNFVFAVSAGRGQGKTAYLRCLSKISQWSVESRQ
jgi:hypothetical protein